MQQTKAVITEIKCLAPGYYYLKLLAPALAETAKAGQFLQIKVAEEGSLDPLLGRPISLYRFDRNEGTVAVIFKVVGRGTAKLAAKQSGEIIEVIGTIGNGFEIPATAKRIALIAGGVGMPPLFCLAEQLQKASPQSKPYLYYGGRNQLDIIEIPAWQALGVEPRVATDDGSMGRKGLVTELLVDSLQEQKYDYLIACGPTPMLKAVQKIAAEYKMEGQVSLEAFMACGVGACLGCVCKTAHGYQRVCAEGPVFAIGEVEL